MKMQATNKQVNKYLNNSNLKNNNSSKASMVFNIFDNFCKKCNFFKLRNYHIYFNH